MDSRAIANFGILNSLPASPREVLALRSTSPAAPIPLAALVFDLNNVLYDATVWQRWLLQLLNRFGVHTHFDAFFCVFEHDYLPAVYRGERDFWEALRDFLISVGMSRGRLEEVLAAAHGKHRELWDEVRPFPGVTATLAQLAARGIRLALLANSGAPATQLVERLKRLGISQRFDVVLSSRDLKASKPAHQCYQAVIDALGLPSDAIGFVGHEPVELAGAALAGMVALALHHTADVQAEVYLDRFDQLLHVVAPLHASQQRAC
jgi:HAD superfamily hydrolase (TIGR01493 family)